MAETLNLGTDGNWASKENSLLGYNSENGNYKPLPFDFTRASNATFVNKSGLIETAANGVPRIDFSDSTSGALLLEPQRTNLITQSELFSDAAWSKVNSSAVGSFNSPSGNLTAHKLIPSATSSVSKYIFTNNNTTTSGIDYNLSVFAKKGEYDKLRIEDGNNSQGAWFDLSNGTLGTIGIVTAKIENYGNGWYRCSVTKPSVTGNIFFLIAASNIESIQVGDGTSGIYIYGAQLEQGSYATSLINTQGSAVTRLADVCSQTVPDGIIGQTEGVMFLDFIYNHSNTSISESLSLSDGSPSNRLYVGNVFANTLSCLIIANSVVQFSAFTSYNLVIGQRYKAALCYKLNNFSFYVNGVEIATDTSGSVPLMNRIGFDSGSGTSNFYKPTNQVKLYNTALTDQELIALTS